MSKKVSWTREQERAIKTKGNVLVAAAARKSEKQQY